MKPNMELWENYIWMTDIVTICGWSTLPPVVKSSTSGRKDCKWESLTKRWLQVCVDLSNYAKKIVLAWTPPVGFFSSRIFESSSGKISIFLPENSPAAAFDVRIKVAYPIDTACFTVKKCWHSPHGNKSRMKLKVNVCLHVCVDKGMNESWLLFRKNNRVQI